eukprot:scaffold5943_cov113-Isochrysis_galbana.AAC.5
MAQPAKQETRLASPGRGGATGVYGTVSWVMQEGMDEPELCSAAPPRQYLVNRRFMVFVGYTIRCASGRMRQDTLLSSGGLASPPFPPASLYLFPRRATYYLRYARLWGVAEWLWLWALCST